MQRAAPGVVKTVAGVVGEPVAPRPAAALIALDVARPAIGTVPAAPLLTAFEPELGTLLPGLESRLH
jgi:hypothetical protein